MITKKMAYRYFKNLNEKGKVQAFVTLFGNNDEVFWLEQKIEEFDKFYPDMRELKILNEYVDEEINHGSV